MDCFFYIIRKGGFFMEKRRPENACKRYVKVRADFLPDGQIRPLMFRGEDGPIYRIDRILDVRPAASLKAGGAGIRYICRVEDRTFHLFHDGSYWFVELPTS